LKHQHQQKHRQRWQYQHRHRRQHEWLKVETSAAAAAMSPASQAGLQTEHQHTLTSIHRRERISHRYVVEKVDDAHTMRSQRQRHAR
jgi:hypothetical protein